MNTQVTETFSSLRVPEKKYPLVSIIITTKNEEKNISNCLESIKLQSYPNLDIIVVDNNSTDKTQQIVAKYTSKFYTKGPERSAQRNYGMIDIAKGEYVVYIDADMILSPHLIDSCVRSVKESGAIALHIPEVVLGKNYFSRVRRFERSFYDGTPIDGARFFDRSTFVHVGGFDEPLFIEGSGEDWDIDKSIRAYGVISLLPSHRPELLGHTVWPLQGFVRERGIIHESSYVGLYHNEAEFSLFTYLRKKSYYSLGFDGYIQKWGRDDPDVRRQFGFVYRFWTVFTEKGKWRRIVAKPGLTAGMYFLRFCVGFVYLLNKVGIVGKGASTR